MGKAHIGGATSVLYGGRFEAGFAFAGAANLMNQVYSSFVGYEIAAGPGGEVVRKNPGQYAVQGANNFGRVNCSGFWCEGGALSLTMNKLLGINALSGFHDTLTGRLEDIWHIPFAITNVPTMPPSAALTYGAIIDHYGFSNDLIVDLKVGGHRK